MILGYDTPLELGQTVSDDDSHNRDVPVGGTVIAWGYFTDEILSVMVLLAPVYRVRNERNYATFHVTRGGSGSDLMSGVVSEIQYFVNIAYAVDDWTNYRGMDV